MVCARLPRPQGERRTGITWQIVAGTVILGAAFYGIIRYPGLLYRSVPQMQGEWRIAALMPLLVLIPVLVVTIHGLWQESNLWPLFVMFSSSRGCSRSRWCCSRCTSGSGTAPRCQHPERSRRHSLLWMPPATPRAWRDLAISWRAHSD